MIDADDVQVMDGPTASVVHHLVGWVVDVTGLNAVEAMLVSGMGGLMGFFGVVAVVATIAERRSGTPQ